MEVIPYMPSLAWMRRQTQAMHQAARHPNRTLLDRQTPLTVPVEGGGRQFRRSPAGSAPHPLSAHGRWTHVHLGAIEAIYARTPYFIHFFPSLSEILLTPPHTLEELNRTILRFMLRAVDAQRLLPLLADPTEAVRQEARRLAQTAQPGLSFIDPIFRLGPEAIFLLAPAF